MNELDSLLKEIVKGDEQIAKTSRMIASDTERRWRQGAGSHYDQMISNRDQAVQALTHSDESVRKVAMSMFHGHWSPDATIEEICRRNTFIGSNDFRISAINSLALIRNKLNQTKVSITLAEYVSNTETEWYVRRNVYSTLVLFFGSDEERLSELNTTAQARLEGKNSIDPRVIERCIAADYTSDHPELKYGKKE